MDEMSNGLSSSCQYTIDLTQELDHEELVSADREEWLGWWYAVLEGLLMTMMILASSSNEIRGRRRKTQLATCRCNSRAMSKAVDGRRDFCIGDLSPSDLELRLWTRKLTRGLLARFLRCEA